jgi:hypothetical protein
MSIINLDKEVKAYDAKKKKLTLNFVARVSKYLDSKRASVTAIRSTVRELNKEEASHLVDIEKARTILTNA